METQTVLASELQEKVIDRIGHLRNPEAMPKYKEELKKYKRRLGKRQEGWITVEGDLFCKDSKRIGFVVDVYGKEVPFFRPDPPGFSAWLYRGYDRSGFTSHAREMGLLADSAHNREILPRRVEEYADAMSRGEWRTLLSDPITLTEDGQVINGQHRLAAASRVEWKEDDDIPAFLVVWGVDPSEALLTDNTKRTGRDHQTIARKVTADA